MKTHVNHGLDIVERSDWLRDATDIVGFHHEKYEGGGYIKGLAGEDIPIAARIFAVADVFDALTSKRPYKDSMPFNETMDVLEQGRGTHFDPNVLDNFGRIARALYDQFANREDEPRAELERMTERYFKEKPHHQRLAAGVSSWCPAAQRHDENGRDHDRRNHERHATRAVVDDTPHHKTQDARNGHRSCWRKPCTAPCCAPACFDSRAINEVHIRPLPSAISAAPA